MFAVGMYFTLENMRRFLMATFRQYMGLLTCIPSLWQGFETGAAGGHLRRIAAWVAGAAASRMAPVRVDAAESFSDKRSSQRSGHTRASDS